MVVARLPIDNYYFVLDGHTPRSVDLMTWAHWNNKANRVVAQVRFGDALVSTVFIGLNHRFGGPEAGPPILFETMIIGGPHDGYCERCATWDEAIDQHNVALQIVHQPPLDAFYTPIAAGLQARIKEGCAEDV